MGTHLFPYCPTHLGLGDEDWIEAQLQRWPLAAANRTPGEVHFISSGTSFVRKFGNLTIHGHHSARSGPEYREWGDDWSASFGCAIRTAPEGSTLFLHGDSVWSALKSICIAKRSGKKIISFVHGARQPCERTLKGADGVVLLREAMQKHVLDHKFPANNIFITRPSIDLSVFKRRHSPGNGPYRLGFVGTICHGKGIKTLLKTISLLEEAEKEVQVDVLGVGTARDTNEFENAIDATRNSFVKVVRHGQLSSNRVAALMTSWDALLHPSYSEGMPITVLEAMAVGIPTVAVRDVLPREMCESRGVYSVDRDGYPAFVSENLDRLRLSEIDDKLVVGHEAAHTLLCNLESVECRWTTPCFVSMMERHWRYKPIRKLYKQIRRALVGK